MENVIDQKALTKKQEMNQFAYYLGPDVGAVTFGGADMKYKENIDEEFLWTPITEANYWTINLHNMRKIRYTPDHQETSESQKYHKFKLCPSGCKSIVDTGTYLIYGPSDQITRLLKDVHLNSCDDISKLPDIAFEFRDEQGKPFEIVLKNKLTELSANSPTTI